MDTLSKMAAACLVKTPIFARGFKNAAHPKLVKQRLFFADLPDAFDGYTILHLTDLHPDSVPGLAGRTVSLIRNLMKEDIPDVCLMTGDYIDRHARRDYAVILKPMKEICSAMTVRDGIFAILGNHDTWKMAAPFQAMGIRMLINETAQIRRGSETIAVTGVDDPNHFYTPDADHALKGGGTGSRSP